MSARWAALALLLCMACSHNSLPGTTIAETPERRAIFTVLQELRSALEARDGKRLLALVSPRYFEDNGTPSNLDDFGFLELNDHLVTDTLGVAHEVELGMEIYEIVVRGDRAHADMRYALRTRLELPAGRVWDTHRDFNRLELAREQGAWKITSGL